MFKNEFQGGPYLEIFSPQGRDAAANWKLGPGVSKVFEKEVKGSVYILEGTPSTNKMHIPKDNKPMTLVQRYLVLQLYLSKGQDFSMEIGVCDLSNNKRRIQLSTALKETQITPLHARIPLCVVRRAVWLNLCLDMVSLVGDTWVGQTYRAIDHIVVSANCKVKRIFTMKSQPPDTTDDAELYGCPNSNSVEVDVIPKHVQLAADIPQFTQVLTMTKIRSAERLKTGKGLVLADQIRSGSVMDLDLNTSGNKGSYHIAFGSKVIVPASESGRRASRLGSTTNRSTRSTLSRADGSLGSGSMHDLRDSQDSLNMSRRSGVAGSSGVSDTGQRPNKTGLPPNQHSVYARQMSEPVSHYDPDSSTTSVNGVSHSHIVTPHPPREPSSDRVRRYHRVKSIPNSSVISQGQTAVDGINVLRDHSNSAGSVGDRTAPDSGIASKTSSVISSAVKTDLSPARSAVEVREGSGDSLRRQAMGHNFASVNGKIGSPLRADMGGGGDVNRESLSDVIALLRLEEPGGRAAEDFQSSDDGLSDSSHPAEYEETDDEGSSDTANKFHLFVSRPKEAPFRNNISPGSSDQDPNKRSHVKPARHNVRRSTSEILSSRGARLEDDFHREMMSSDEDEYQRVRQGSRPHSGTSATGSPKVRSAGSPKSRTTGSPKTRATGSPKTRANNNSAGERKGKTPGVPKVSVSPDFKRPAFNPALYSGAGGTPRGAATPGGTPVRHSRKSLREIRPQDSAHNSKSSEKLYDHTKYQMADVTESFEARMLASMRRHHEDDLEDITPSSTLHQTQVPQPHPPPPPVSGGIGGGGGGKLKASQHAYNESPYTTSDDDTSFSTWKAPAPNQMAHNYQDEMKSRLSSDTLTSSNPRDWSSSVFSPPIVLPSNGDLQGTLEGQFEDLNDASPSDAHTTGPSASEDEELDLMYDPNLNAYYDPRTLKYYELAT